MEELGKDREEKLGESILERMDPRIMYVSVLPPPSGASTTIQGFSRERMALGWVWRVMLKLPSTIFEPAAPAQATIGLRACGMAGWRHLAVRIERLLSIRVHERSPFWVVFSGDPQVAQYVSEWAKFQPYLPLHVSTESVPGAVSPSDVTFDMLRTHCLDLIAAHEDSLSGLRHLVDEWRNRDVIPAPFPFLGHQTVEPNQACLTANGIEAAEFVEHWRGATEQEFEDAIVRIPTMPPTYSDLIAPTIPS